MSRTTDGNPAQPPAGPPAIHTRRLTKRYPDSTLAVDSLDLTIAQGEFFGLLGPNGAGKTTTIGMLTTLIIPTNGEASVAGWNVRTQPVQVKRAIGVVSQTNTLDRSLTVSENLYYHARYFGFDRSTPATPRRACCARSASNPKRASSPINSPAAWPAAS